MHGRRLLIMACLVAVASGCRGPATTVKPGLKASPAAPVVTAGSPLADALEGLKTRSVAQAGAPVTLTGKVKLISDNGGGLLSDSGGSIISNNTGGLVSDNGGGLVSNNSAGLIGNHAAGLRLLAAAGKVATAGLADAVVLVTDAAGNVLTDAKGQPLAAVTDAHGAYTLKAGLPAGNVVLRVKLFPHAKHPASGGFLSAMLGHPNGSAVTRDLDTASSLGAAYVLGQYVKGDQTIYDKLPDQEATQLAGNLATQPVTTAPAYKQDELVGLTEALRKTAPAVDRTLGDIHALLLGLAGLKDGGPATTLPLGRPGVLALDPTGQLLIGEFTLGRVRTLALDGTLSTLLDVARGKVKQNIPNLADMVIGPDGSLYLGTLRSVDRVTPAGVAEHVAGVADDHTPYTLGGPAATSHVDGRRIAVGADGRLYIAQTGGENATGTIAPVVMVDDAGKLVRRAADGFAGTQNFDGLVAAPDGALYALKDDGRLYVLPPGQLDGMEVALDRPFEVSGDAHMARLADGRLVITEPDVGQVEAIATDGSHRELLLGPGVAGAPTLLHPAGVASAPDGTLYVSDLGSNLVYRRDAHGAWTTVAGAASGILDGDPNTVLVNGPTGATVDQAGNLVFSEESSNSLRRFDGQTLTTIAGGVRGFAGDGGPASAARFDQPKGLATAHDGSIFLIDQGNRRLRKIDPQGLVSTLADSHGSGGGLQLAHALGLALDPVDDTPYWADLEQGVVQRLRGGVGQLVAGSVKTSTTGLIDLGSGDGPALSVQLSAPGGLAFHPTHRPSELYLTELGSFRIAKVTNLDGDAPTISTFCGKPVAQVLAFLASGEPLPDEEGLDASQVTPIVPLGLCFGPDGTLYIGEAGTTNMGLLGPTFGTVLAQLPATAPKVYPRIRKVTPDGKVYTVAGPGGHFFTDPTAADALQLPAGLVVDGQGRLVILDVGANLVRLLPAGSF